MSSTSRSRARTRVRGASLPEYAFLLVAVLLVAAGAYRYLGRRVDASANRTIAVLDSGGGSGGAGGGLGGAVGGALGGATGGAGGEGLGGMVRDFFRGVVMGDFAEDLGVAGQIGQVVGGFIPVVGQLADIRDTGAAVWGVIQGREGAWFDLGTSVVGYVPGLGDAAKNILRRGDEAVTSGIKNGDEASGAVAGAIRRNADKLPSNIDEAVAGVRRAPGSDPVLYRGDGRSPDVIFNEGFQPKGTDVNGRPFDPSGSIQDRVQQDTMNPTGEFVATSTSRDASHRFAEKENGWVYVVDSKQPKGHDVNEMLGKDHVFGHESEVKFGGEGLAKDEVVGAYNPKTGEWRNNPNYTPAVSPPDPANQVRPADLPADRPWIPEDWWK